MRTSTTVLIVALLLFTSLQPAAALQPSDTGATEGQFHSVTIETGQDHDDDGHATITAVEIQADTSLDDTDIVGSNPGEPYFEVEIDGEEVVQTNVVSRSETHSTRLEIPQSALDDLDRGRHSITVKLGDADGDIDDSDVGNDDLIASWEDTFRYEPATDLTLRATRSETVVGSPVSIGVDGRYDAALSWDVVDAPSGSSAAIHNSNSGVATFTPDAAGSYEVRASANGQTATIELSASSESEHGILQRYAPRIELASGEQYRPTRYEAFVQNARLEDFGEEDVPDPSTFDLVDRSSDWELDLRGSESDYPDYQQEYPPTVYGSVHEDISFRGQQYDYAVTYWLFYVYDPKQADGLSSLLAHQSDLETVTVLVDDGTPQWVGASQHYGGELREWSKTTHQGTHVSIYPARGAHSNYLRDTAEYDGNGLLGQQQFVTDGGSAAIISDSVYTDETGGGPVFSTTGSGTGYELAVLTGDEYLASYDGLFGPDGGDVPMARERWTDVGSWLEDALLPDEAQVDTDVTGTVSAAEDELTARAEIENVGPKPSQFWATLRVKPASSTWTSQAVQTVATDSVRVGTEQHRTVSVSGAVPPGSAGEWDGRLVVTSYPPDTSEQEDVQFTHSSEGLYTVSEAPTTDTSDPPSEPNSSESTEQSTAESTDPSSSDHDQNDSSSPPPETDSTAPAEDDETSSSPPGETNSGSPGETNSGSPGETNSGSPGETNSGSPGETNSSSPGETSSGSPGFTLPITVLVVLGGALVLGRHRADRRER